MAGVDVSAFVKQSRIDAELKFQRAASAATVARIHREAAAWQAATDAAKVDRQVEARQKALLRRQEHMDRVAKLAAQQTQVRRRSGF